MSESKDRQIVRIKTVMKMTGISRPQLYQMVKRGEFPSQIRLSKRSAGWFKHEIESWMDSLPKVNSPEVKQ